MTSLIGKFGFIRWSLGSLVAVLALASFEIEAAEVTREVIAMGTRLMVSVTATDADKALLATEAAIKAVAEVEERLSTWRPNSDVSRINRAEVGQWVEVSRKTSEDLSFAVAMSRTTGGAFHPGMGALVGAWLGFGDRTLPDSREIEDLRSAINQTNLEIESGRIRRLRALYLVDTGAFGKGIALRDAVDSGLEAGVVCIDLNFGGQVMRSGSCQETRISIANPRQRWSSVAACQFATGSLATSGNSERSIVIGSDRIAHIIDPRNGRPSLFDGSVTVKSDDPVVADALSTALFVMGPEAGREWIESAFDLEVEALWIAADGEPIWSTPGFELHDAREKGAGKTSG